MIPNAKLNSIKQEGEIFKVYVNAPAVDGKANEAVVKLLAEYFKIKKRDITILKGEKNPIKTIEFNTSQL